MNAFVEASCGQAVARATLSTAFLAHSQLAFDARYFSALDFNAAAIAEANVGLGDLRRSLRVLIAGRTWLQWCHGDGATLLVRVVRVQRLYYHNEARIVSGVDGDIWYGYVRWRWWTVPCPSRCTPFGGLPANRSGPDQTQ